MLGRSGENAKIHRQIVILGETCSIHHNPMSAREKVSQEEVLM